MKKGLLSVVFGLIFLAMVASPASALTCKARGQIYYSYATTAGVYYVIGGFPTLDYYYLVFTSNAFLIGQMNAAAARSGYLIDTQSTATSCPTSTTGINNWGTLKKVTLNPTF
ncbi:MAG: hypothetical protein AB9866_03010 [Syntrophobacteraceae bacterium]